MLITLLKSKMESAVGVLLRVPGLFIIDYWGHLYRYKPNSMEIRELLNCFVPNFILLLGFLLLLLPLRYVKTLYTHFIGLVLIVLCHILSERYIEFETEFDSEKTVDDYYLTRRFAVLIVHISFGFLVSYLLKDSWDSTYLLRGPSYIPPIFEMYGLPVFARLANLPVHTLPFFHNVCRIANILSILLYISYRMPEILNCAKSAYTNALTDVETYGFGTLITMVWNKLFVPMHFAVFWIIEFVVRVMWLLYQVEKLDEWYILILTTVCSICASPVKLVATSVTVSYLSYFMLCATRAYLQGFSELFHDNPMYSGWTEGLTLTLLSIQTGLVEMKMPTRMAVMTIILFIVLSSLLQSMLEIAEPVVLGLSATRSRSHWKHFRALSLCFTLLTFPLYLTKVLSGVFPIDFWMVVVLSSCTLTSVQVLDLLVVHSLFIYDSARAEPWENLDDIVYYTRAVTKVLEFFVAIFVVGMGLWESTAGKWYWVNASILLVHCYFNVWQRLQTGWRSFLLRRDAAKKAKSLPSATEEQLILLDDVCSICFGNMKSACVTLCKHYFHRNCLRKWLYVQDKCPLCHGIISLSSEEVKAPENANEPRMFFAGPFF